ncbi:MAG: endonuclease [Chthoniobacterales bacterium]
MAKEAQYSQIISHVFAAHYKRGAKEVVFDREEIVDAAVKLGLPRPKNIGDVVYSFRFRKAFPEAIKKTAPEGLEWILRKAGASRYRFVLSPQWSVVPDPHRSVIKVPDATPGVIAKYALSDEQALLAILRYNRLIDLFSAITCYSLQSHLRTSVAGMGGVETDEMYVGVSRNGVHYVLPVQAKGGRDRLSVVQIEQDIALCAEKFPSLVCRPIAAQFMRGDVIALFEFEVTDEQVTIRDERHYRLVPPDELSAEELAQYRRDQS